MPLYPSSNKTNTNKPRTIYPFIVIPLLAIMLIAATLTLYLKDFAHAAPTTPLLPLPGTLPPVLAHSQLIGSANPNQVISLSIGLRLRNSAALKNYLDDISRPKSTNYHRYLSPSQFSGAFSPSKAAHNAILQYLRHAGFTITSTFTHRTLIVFQGTIGLAEQVFHVAINNYTAPGGSQFFSNTTDPLLPSSLIGSVITISGLNNAIHFHHSSLDIRGNSTSTHTTRASLNPLSCPSTSASYYLPSQLAAAYNLNGLYSAGYHGEGQTVALFELDSTQMSDITNYRTCFDQGSNTSISTILINGGPGTAGSGGSSGPAEVDLDAQLVLSAAPKLGVLRLYEAHNDVNDANAEWARIMQDAPAVVSTSWGECEADLPQGQSALENANFTAMAAQGQTVFASSGDNGSSACFSDNSNPPNTQLNVSDPASQPFVTGVGGTTLTVNTDNSYNAETTWNNQPANSTTPQGGASGGGVSTIWQHQTWQAAPGVDKTANRQVPDVSLHADPARGYLFYCTETVSGCSSSSSWLGVGGTSAAAPMWAAFMALTNEQSIKNGGFNLGFINPLLYQIASGANYAKDFHDITTGNNDFNALHSGQYAAVTGYDPSTGLGSYNALNLAADMVANAKNNQRAAPANTTWYFAEGSVGAGFHEYITVQNPDTTKTANLTLTYLIQGQAAKTVTHMVSPGSRQTIDVNSAGDLNDPQNSPVHLSVATILKSDIPVVAERPMYFNNVLGVSSGTNVIGATTPQKTYYFSEGDSTSSGSASYNTFLTMLNPSTTLTDTVSITYYTGACGGTHPACPVETITLKPQQRGTASPTDQGIGLHQKLSISVSSNNPVVVERPLYFKDTIANAGGVTTGAASEVGATAPGMDWLFAEGYTGADFQEYFELANFGTKDAHVNVKLEYTNGDTQTVPETVPALGHVPFDVNNANAHPGTCVPAPCSVTTSVSAEITSTDNPIVADRLMYFHFGGHISGGTDVVGTPAAQNVYAFAEGYTNGTFSEFLTLQNPTANNETVAITFFVENTGAPSTVFQQAITVPAHSRRTISVNNAINLIQSGSVSATVQALAGGTIVAERPQYFVFGYPPSPGGTNVIGYTGS